MDAQTCLKKMGYVGVLSFATVGSEGNPQARNISAIHYETDAVFLQPEEKISAKNFWIRERCRCSVIPRRNLRRYY